MAPGMAMRVSCFLRGAAAALLLAACADSAAGQPRPTPRPEIRILDTGALDAAQPAKLAEAVAALRPGVPGETELFAVLAAWYPDQRVFLREVEQAASILAERFAADGRIVTLASSSAEPLRHPLATPESLSAAVRALAAGMNPEDVLMVYLTSHGLPGMLVPGEGALRTPPLTAEELGRILDESGAPHVALVISACRSGSFIPAVRGPERLVIAAAAADRNSFGCSDASDWTWFGRAFFDEALRETRHLPRAFERAAALVAGWETAEGFAPSRPQMAQGAEIGQALQALEADAGG